MSMSSSKGKAASRTTSKTATRASAKSGAKSGVKSSATTAARAMAKKLMSAEPPSEAKTAFAKAMLQGVQPGTEAARSVARKKNGSVPQAPQVEVLRKIPAPVEIVENEASARAVVLAQEIEKALRDGDFEKFQPHAQQALISAVCRLYSANNDIGNRFGAIGQPSAVNATDVMILCGALLKAVDLQVFELGLWQSWSSR